MSYLLETDAELEDVKKVVNKHLQKLVHLPNSSFTNNKQYVISIDRYEDRIGVLKVAGELVVNDLRNSDVQAYAEVKKLFPSKYVTG